MNICDFKVTISTYRHPPRADKVTKENPVMTGSTITHSHKTFELYFLISGNMVQLKPELQKLKVFDTGGELNVQKAFRVSFPSAANLLCFTYVEENIIRKYSSLNKESKNYTREIFVMRSRHVKVDFCLEQEFEEYNKKLSEIWRLRPNGVLFTNYIDQLKQKNIKGYILASISTRYL